jgi:succinoglycan biosynthesis transport protein ExoP
MTHMSSNANSAINLRESDLDITPKEILLYILANLPLLLTCSIGGIASSFIVTKLTPPVWQGTFSLLVNTNDEDKSTISSTTAALSSLLGSSGGVKSELETQVKILESPSVLLPIFNKVKERKKLQGYSVDSFYFRRWVKSSLDVEVEKNTSIITINYRDTDKDLILPVLNQISLRFRSYSLDKRAMALHNSLAYLKSQQKKFIRDSAISGRKLELHSLRYGFPLAQATSPAPASVSSSLLQSPLSEFAKLADLSSDTLSSKGDTLDRLAAINMEIIKRRQAFTDQDPSVRSLLLERLALKKYLESTAGGYISSPSGDNLSKTSALNILLTQQDLSRQAKRDKTTLANIESSILSTELNIAQKGKPWELISQPNLLEKPISPKLSINLLLGFLIGSLLGISVCIYKGKTFDPVLTPEELSRSLACPIIFRLSKMSDSWKQIVRSFAASSTSSPLDFIVISNESSLQYSEVFSFFTEVFEANSLSFSFLDHLPSLSFANRIVILAHARCISKQSLSLLVQQINITGVTLLGIVWLD